MLVDLLSSAGLLSKAVHALNSVIWSPALVALLLGAGLYLSIRTRFVQIRRLPLMIRSLFSRSEKIRGISSFEAFCVALSGHVGTGNIIGVATAIAFGGPGAVFWMWITALLGASTSFTEVTLAQLFKFHHETGYRGGPAAYIDKGLKLKWLGVLFAILTIIGYGVFLTTVQANGMASALSNSFNISPLVSGIALAAVLALVIIGGIRSIARVASIVTPFMALGYILMAIVVVALHSDAVPAAFASIFRGAFGLDSVSGGIIGTAVMMGVKRGIFSNEAGQGGGAIVSASADVPHPARQGLAQSFSVYVDTLLVCTATALMILCSGTYNVFSQSTGEMTMANVPELGNNYVGYTQAAVDSVLPGIGNTFVSLALIFFVFTTIMAYYFYSESSIIYLFFGRRSGSRSEKACIWAFRLVLLAATVFGALNEADLIWQLGDVGVGLTAWINVISLLILCPLALKALKEYEQLYPGRAMRRRLKAAAKPKKDI